MYLNENHLETREHLIRYFTRYLGMELGKVNPAFRFIRIETPVLFSPEKSTTPVLRPTTASAAHSVSKELLSGKGDGKYKLPLVIWQQGRVFTTIRRQTKELYVAEYEVLYGKTTGAQYMPRIIWCCENMLRKQCGKIFKADEDETRISIFTQEGDLELAHIHERNDFLGGKNIEITFNMDTCTEVNIQHEFGKIRRAAPVDKK